MESAPEAGPPGVFATQVVCCNGGHLRSSGPPPCGRADVCACYIHLPCQPLLLSQGNSSLLPLGCHLRHLLELRFCALRSSNGLSTACTKHLDVTDCWCLCWNCRWVQKQVDVQLRFSRATDQPITFCYLKTSCLRFYSVIQLSLLN